MSQHNKAHKRLLKVAERDEYTCWICHCPVVVIRKRHNTQSSDAHRASVDHVIPRADGGTNDLFNLRLAHQSCNAWRAGDGCRPFATPQVTRHVSAPYVLKDLPRVGIPTTVTKQYFANL